MPEIRMNSLKSLAMNCGPLSEMIWGFASGLKFLQMESDDGLLLPILQPKIA
jgi:hypothetical protein